MNSRAARVFVLVGVTLVAACTTEETGSIELAASAMMPAPKPPMPAPKPPMPPMPCAVDMDCPMPRSHCNVALAQCGECSPDAGCGPAERCGMDSMCHPMP